MNSYNPKFVRVRGGTSCFLSLFTFFKSCFHMNHFTFIQKCHQVKYFFFSDEIRLVVLKKMTIMNLIISHYSLFYYPTICFLFIFSLMLHNMWLTSVDFRTTAHFYFYYKNILFGQHIYHFFKMLSNVLFISNKEH